MPCKAAQQEPFDREEIGQRLRQVLDDFGVSQAEASRVLGITDGAVNRWLQGKSVPSLGQLVILARLCGFHGLGSFTYALGLHDEEPPERYIETMQRRWLSRSGAEGPRGLTKAQRQEAALSVNQECANSESVAASASQDSGSEDHTKPDSIHIICRSGGVTIGRRYPRSVDGYAARLADLGYVPNAQYTAVR